MSLKTALSTVLRKPEFLVVGSLLLVAAVGLNGATEMMKLHFKKVPVNLQRPLKDLPATMGNWTQTSLDNPLSHDMEEVLQTKTYIFRDYVDTRRVTKSQLAAFDDKDYTQRLTLAAGLQRSDPSAVIHLSVTYYTGMVDTVAHIPDRCFVADGYIPTDANYPLWSIVGLPVDETGHRNASKPDKGLPVRFMSFEDQDNRAREKKDVTYFFQVNGRYVSAPDAVRIELQDLFQKHGYYAKVEVMTSIDDRATCEAVMRDFLKDAMPEIEKCMPDWAAVEAGKGDGGSGTAPPAATPEAPTTAPSAAGK